MVDRVSFEANNCLSLGRWHRLLLLLWRDMVYSHQRLGPLVTPQKRPTPDRKTAFDAVAVFVDTNGNQWKVLAEFKSSNGRPYIAAISISPTRGAPPLTRRVLRDLEINKLFKNEIALEVKQFSRTRRKLQSKSAHQGRAHTDKELETVAEIYMSAFRAHQPVRQSVADTLGISVSTAEKRITAARRKGFIPTKNKEDK